MLQGFSRCEKGSQKDILLAEKTSNGPRLERETKLKKGLHLTKGEGTRCIAWVQPMISVFVFAKRGSGHGFMGKAFEA